MRSCVVPEMHQVAWRPVPLSFLMGRVVPWHQPPLPSATTSLWPTPTAFSGYLLSPFYLLAFVMARFSHMSRVCAGWRWGGDVYSLEKALEKVPVVRPCDLTWPFLFFKAYQWQTASWCRGWASTSCPGWTSSPQS